jgi:hypothetical protein
MADQWQDPITPGLTDRRPPPKRHEQTPGAIIVAPVQSPSSWAKCRACKGTFQEAEIQDGECGSCREEKQEEAAAEPAPEPPRREEIRPSPRVHHENGSAHVSSLRAELRVLERLASDLERLDPAARKRVAAWLAAWLGS